jgi:hypothetical protein
MIFYFAKSCFLFCLLQICKTQGAFLGYEKRKRKRKMIEINPLRVSQQVFKTKSALLNWWNVL